MKVNIPKNLPIENWILSDCGLCFRHLEGALNEFEPDILVYNAGTDVLDGDPLGCLSISPQVSSD